MSMLKLFSIFFIICFLSFKFCIAQIPSNPIPVSPNAASLGKYADVPVGTFTGIPSITVPIYEIKEGNISMPISLSYHASGIKVEEVASWVGLGWSLNAGGMISRTIRGKEDPVQNGFYFDQIEDFKNADDLGKQQLADFISKGDIDSEADIYNYNFGTYSGKFVMFPDGKFHSIPLNNLDIKLENNIFGNRWIITTPEGIKYVFGLSTDNNKKALDANNTQMDLLYGPIGNTSYSGAVTSWHLLEVIDPLGNKIELKYSPANYWFQGADLQTMTFDQVGSFMKSETFSTINNFTGVRLSEISFSNGKVLFVPEGNERNDLVGDRALASITIENGNSSVPPRIFRFSYGYFGFASEKITSRRLRLDLVQEEGKSPYLFSYENFYSLPDRISYNKDHWGFYNAKINTVTVPSFKMDSGMLVELADKRSDELPMKAAILKRVTFPTGGNTEYEFEINQVVATSYEDEDTNISKVALAQLVDSEFFEETFVVHGNESNPTQLGNSGMGSNGIISLTGDTYCYLDNGCIQIKIVGVDNARLYIFDKLNPPNEFFIENGTYRIQISWTYETGCIMQQDPNLWIAAQLIWQELNNENLNQYLNKNIGGLRIKRIVSQANDSSPALETTFNYQNFEDSVLSSGYMLVNPTYFYYYHNNDAGFNYNPWEMKLKSTSSYPLLTMSGGYAGYSNVEVKYGSGGVYGKSRYFFSNIPHFQDVLDYPEANSSAYFDGFSYPPFNPEEYPTPVQPPTSFDWRRGRLDQKDDYEFFNGSFRIIKRIENNYAFVNPPGFNPSAQGLAVSLAGTKLLMGPVDESPPLIAKVYTFKFYDTVTEFSYLASTLETSFSYTPLQQTVTKQTEFSYYNYSHLSPSKVKENLNGIYKSTFYSYPDDFNSGTGFLDELKASNIIGIPIEKVVMLEDEEGNEQRIVEGTVFKFKPGGKGMIDELWKIETSNPIPLSSFKFSGLAPGVIPGLGLKGAFNFDPSYKRKQDFSLYDSKGNIRQIQEVNGIPIVYLWGYGAMYPIGEIKNATYEEVSAALGGEAVVESISSSGSISLSQLSQLNNLRIQLPQAMVTTYTYTPLVGITSIIDPKGRITYYEYDSLGQLINIKDHDGNILKNHTYHYFGQ